MQVTYKNLAQYWQKEQPFKRHHRCPSVPCCLSHMSATNSGKHVKQISETHIFLIAQLDTLLGTALLLVESREAVL